MVNLVVQCFKFSNQFGLLTPKYFPTENTNGQGTFNEVVDNAYLIEMKCPMRFLPKYPGGSAGNLFAEGRDS